MVMKGKAMRKNLRQSIVKSFGRYLAIAIIIALGSGLFLGLLMTKTDMLATGQQYMDQQNMFDLRAMSNYGWTEEYVQGFAKLDGIAAAEGVYYTDLIASMGQEPADSVHRFYAIPEQINKLALRGGRMPQAPNECLADGFQADDSVLGQTVTISQSNSEEALSHMKETTFTVVGYVASPLYMDMNRGTTSVGSGSLGRYFFVPREAVDMDYYMEIDLKLPGNYAIYSDAYNDYLDEAAKQLEENAKELSQRRFEEVKAEAEERYDEGYQEYMDGVQEYEDGKAEAEQELKEAEQKLKDGEKELETNRQKLIDGGNQIEDGRKKIHDGRLQLQSSRTLLQQQLEEINTQIPGAEEAVKQAEAIIGKTGDALKGEIASARDAVRQAQAVVDAAQAELNTAIAERDAIAANPDSTEEEKAQAQAKVDAAQAALDAAQIPLESAKTTLSELERLYNEVYQPAADALMKLVGFKGQMEAGLAEIESNLAMLDQKEEELNAAYNTLMVNWGKWNQGKKDLEDGWDEYEKAKVDVRKELADAKRQLDDAKQELVDARTEINEMDKPELIILDRTSNVGYNNLDSTSDIVSGVSRVFPVFFLLIASLVCITTMTRMIDEERTQIGTLKALGYTNREIMHKYLFYSGSSAILGCGLGILAGSTVFPQIIWKAYCIMLHIQPNVVLTVNWPLSAAILAIYTAVMLLVTWSCCRRTLEEVPAELIRPKAPNAGKKILIEYLPFWKKISFLNKVTLRNIFRYRQRLLMMLVGIGGCTALLLTGFGLRDSIANVAAYQFENVTEYDISVYFRDSLAENQAYKFEKAIKDHARDYMYYHQSSIKVEFDNRTKEIYLLSGDKDMQNFITMEHGDTPVAMPGEDQVVLSAGVAENLGIRKGDVLVLRNADLDSMELTVSGIYDNHVYNYAIVSPETYQAHWGSLPELQMAFVTMNEGEDVHALGAAISNLSFVMNVAVGADLADMVSNMMDALDLVVWVIVFCAGLLAVTVLYNLTNINITERLREIATIKVLGFNAAETASYVFKENLALTVIGTVLGLGLGKLLLIFVMSQIKIDMVWFKVLTEPQSYLWSALLTLLSAVVVDFIFYFKLDKINMAEALKSVE